MKVVHARSGNSRAGIIRQTNFHLKTLAACPLALESGQNGNNSRVPIRMNLGSTHTLQLYRRDQLMLNPVFLVRA